tara:strand:- start:1605 stop:1868 length:264 start_codon:yes stop_codon:yes gene_type:complete
MELTTEQEFRIRTIEIAVNDPKTEKKDLITLLMALQRQNFVLGNAVTNLLNSWPKPPTTKDQNITDEVPLMFGILLGTKNLDSTSET